MEKSKLKRNRKKLFPYTIVVKISESSYNDVLQLSEKLEINKSETFREVINIGIKNLKDS